MTNPESERLPLTSPHTIRTGRRIRVYSFLYIAIAIIISLVMAAILMHSWQMFFIALGVGIAYVLLLSAPAFLAFVSRAKHTDSRR